MSDPAEGLEVYLVGGAVRDQLLNYCYDESDWVVLGSTVDELLKRGFKRVGKDFPVFLHPDTGEEFALARTERKSGHGYAGFQVHASPEVTLEEDLARRDLTINAMAKSASGHIVDPYNGQGDLNRKLLKHVSDNFSEDPLRVLRVARFAARYHHLSFSIAEETQALMRVLSRSGELDFLVAERVWRETERALAEPSPDIYFRVLSECDAAETLFKGIDLARGIPLLTYAAANTSRADCRWAALLSKTPDKQITTLYQTMQWPKRFQQLALAISHADTLSIRSAREAVALISRLDAWRRDELFDGFCTTLLAMSDASEMQSAIERLAESRHIAKPISMDAVAHLNLTGPEIGHAIEAARIESIAHLF